MCLSTSRPVADSRGEDPAGKALALDHRGADTAGAEPPGKLAADTPQPLGSRRRRLWELPDHCHCPVLGVCLPLPLLRKRVAKAVDARLVMDDYRLHVRCVHECRRRTPVSEALQRELDARCAAGLRRFAAAKSAEAVLAMWRDAVRRGDIAEALWAALSHPRCDEQTTELIYGDVHMIQHQAGAVARGDRQQIEARLQQGEAAARELTHLQQRQQQWQAERAAEVERLQAELMRARAELVGRDSLLAAARADLDELRQTVPDLATRSTLAERLAEMTERNRELARQLAERSWAREAGPAPVAEALPEEQLEPAAQEAALPAIDLGAKAVLCVGGRHGVVAIYRDLVERHGGRFVHHDGGREDNAHQLDASLAAADLVICQTGCISHNAYWLVKNHCKRTGKRCVYLDKPSASSFARGLQQVPAAELPA